jgi:hypothetical protein
MAQTHEKLVAVVSGEKTLTLDVYPGFTAAQVIALLNGHEAAVQGDEVVAYAEIGDSVTPMAKVLESSDGTTNGAWRLAAEAEHAQCCNVSPAERDRNFATSIIHRADRFANDGKHDAAASLLAAAVTLLDESGGRECDAAVWLITAQGNSLALQKKEAEAEPLFRQAIALAQLLYDHEHPCVAVCIANLGELLVNSGRQAEGKLLLEEAVAKLSAAHPDGNYNAEYIAGVIAAVRNLVPADEQPA